MAETIFLRFSFCSISYCFCLGDVYKNMFSFDSLAVCYGYFLQWCVSLPVSFCMWKYFNVCWYYHSGICCSDSLRKRKGYSRVLKCRKLATATCHLCTILSSSSIVILILFNPTKIIQNKSMYHNISNIYVSSFKSVLGERFSLKERAFFEICLSCCMRNASVMFFLESFTDRIEILH